MQTHSRKWKLDKSWGKPSSKEMNVLKRVAKQKGWCCEKF